MHKKFILCCLFLAFLLLLSQAKAEETVCAKEMVTSDDTFSVKGSANGAVSFSDIGCTVIIRPEFCAMEMIEFDNTAEVRDFVTAEKIKMTDSFYVADSGIETPLKYGIIVFKEREKAEKFVVEHGKGKVLTYDELVERDIE